MIKDPLEGGESRLEANKLSVKVNGGEGLLEFYNWSETCPLIDYSDI